MFSLQQDIKRSLLVLIRNLRVLGIGAAAGLLLGVAYLHIVKFNYSVTLQVVPVQNSNSGLSSMLGGLSGLAGFAGVALPGAATQIDVYKAELVSTDVAEEMLSRPEIAHHLFESRWDDRTHKWKLHQSLFRVILHGLLGIPALPPSPPTIVDMQSVLTTQLDIQGDRSDPTIKLSFSDPDPDFAKYFLLAVHHAADEKMRARTINRATKYITYLNNELATVTSNEQREALIQTLSEQEQSKMFAGSNVAFAAEVFTQPIASMSGRIPKPLGVLFEATLLGIAAAAAAVLAFSHLGRRPMPAYAPAFLRD